MLEIVDVQARVTHVHTRIPFRYGIAEMVAAPHVVVEVTLSAGSRTVRGWASEHLPPKWFTKDPESAFIDDIAEMVGVVEHAVSAARGLTAPTPFDLWLDVQAEQDAWGARNGIPGLLSGLGSSLVERAMIDAACRLAGVPFARALRDGTLGFDAGRIHHELAGRASPFGPDARTSIAVRHTVGLSDPLTDAEVSDDPRDGLPVSLEAIIERYGVTYFKIKTAGVLADDIPRLRSVVDILERHGVDGRFTIDGNESMRTATHLVEWSRGLLADERLGPILRQRLIAVEQPFHRSIALGPEAAAALAELADDVAVIVDESDNSVGTVRAAMDLGYAGGTYKGCKGVFRGLANAALVAARGGRAVLTAEDLSTVPPLTTAQDLVVAHAMGLTHIERNGHHYFGQLAPLDPAIEELALAAHPDAYERHADGRARLRVSEGAIDLTSLLEAPFGFAPELDISGLEPLSVAAATRGM